MTGHNREQVRRVITELAGLPDSEREAALARACGGDAALRSEVEALLREEKRGGFMAPPGADSAATVDGACPDGGTPVAGGPRERGGQMIGRYKLLQPIGEGGFGTVWMAEQKEPVKRRVALKIIKRGMDTDQVIARFEAERQALAMMDHPNIAKVLDAGSTDAGRPYFVMEYIKGVPILEYCDTEKLHTRARLELFTGVCHAIQHAHQKGIIHRDIKPSNVLVTMHDGVPVPKVIDFGIAKATGGELTATTYFTEHRQMIGTPAYMSPEQAEMSGLDIDTRSDIYSLGVLLYELLTGTTPFAHEDLMSKGVAEMMRIIREVEPHKPSTRLSSLGDTGTRTAMQRRAADPEKLGGMLRGDLDWIVMKCLEKDRTRRYETASGLAADIGRHLRDEPVSAGPPSAAYRIRKFARRHRRTVFAGGVVAAALVLGVIGTSVGMVKAIRATNRANEEAAKATLAAEAAAGAKVRAQENERLAVAEAERAEAAAAEERKARARAETISEFVTRALRAGDAQNSGGGQDMTILAAMENAIADIVAGRFKDDPETEAGLKSTIATVLLHNGRPAEAEPLAASALATRERLHPGDHRDVALSLNNLALVRQQLGRTAEAEPLLVRSVEMYERIYEGDHPDVAKALDNLARARQELGRPAEAEAQLARALEMRRRLYPGDDPDLATGMNNLALVEQELGRLTQAEPLYLGALEMWQRLYEGDHPDIATGLHNLAHVRLSLGRGAEAEPLLVQALEMWQRLYRGDHPDVAGGLNALASVKRSLGRGAEAEPLQVRALEMYRRLYNGDHPDVAASLSNLASVRQMLNRTSEAEPLFAEALEMYRRIYQDDHPSVANGLSNLARARQALGQREGARQGFDEALAMLRRLGPGGSPNLARVLSRSAGARLENGGEEEAAAALRELEEAAAIGEKMLSPDHPQLKEYREALAACRVKMGK